MIKDVTLPGLPARQYPLHQKMQWRVFLVWLVLFVVSVVAPLSQANTVSIGEGVAWPLNITEQTTVFKDPTGTLALQDVLEAIQVDAGRQSLLSNTHVATGKTTAWWMNWVISNNQTQPLNIRLVLSPFNSRELDFYLKKGSSWTHVRAGWSRPSSQHDVKSRLPTLPLMLAPGESMVIWARVRSDATRVVTPHIYREAPFHAYEVRMALWDALLFGGLLALAWSALMIALMSRNRAFVILAAMTLAICASEAMVRGYGQFFLWPESPLWRYRSVPILGHLSVALFAWFIVDVARQENIRLPLSKCLTAIVVINFGLALLAAADHIYLAELIGGYIGLIFIALVVVCVIMLIRQGAPTRRLILVVGLFIAIRGVMKFLEKAGWLPEVLSPPGLDGLGVNPVLALLGFYLNLTLLSGWITFVGKQRKEAAQALTTWQEEENVRLSDEVQRQTKALNQALEYANEKNREKTEILGYVSHDLRAPLATIVGYTRLIEKEHLPAQTEYLQAIQRNAKYQMDLIDDLLTYAKSELKPLALEPKLTPFTSMLDEVAQQAAILSQQQNNQFVCIADTELPACVFVDERRLKQALLNLLSNAAKFSRQGTITLTVAALPDREPHQWLIQFSVSDTGLGITPTEQRELLEELQQVPTKQRGDGLGLHIVQNIVRQMGGELHMYSRPQEGSCFAFVLCLSADGQATTWWRPPALPQDTASAHTTMSLRGENTIPPQDRMELALMARDGHLTDIDQWIARIARSYPHCTEFLHEIDHALQALDLSRIEALALSGQDKTAALNR